MCVNVYILIVPWYCDRFPEVSMSLCGGLQERKDMTEMAFADKFQLNIVTFDDFCRNPNMIRDPRLVFKIDDRYVNLELCLSEKR